MARNMTRSHFSKPKYRKPYKPKTGDPVQREKISPPTKSNFTRRERKAMRLGETVKSLAAKYKKRGKQSAQWPLTPAPRG